MNDAMQFLPLLNLLIIPVFGQYMAIQIRLTKLEEHKKRVEDTLGFHRRTEDML